MTPYISKQTPDSRLENTVLSADSDIPDVHYVRTFLTWWKRIRVGKTPETQRETLYKNRVHF
jgi:hypothetical protein